MMKHLTFAFLLAACSSSSSSSNTDSGAPLDTTVVDCNTPDKCANEPPPSSDSHAACLKAYDDADCGPVLKEALTCKHTNETCNAEGKNDLKAKEICQTQIAPKATQLIMDHPACASALASLQGQ